MSSTAAAALRSTPGALNLWQMLCWTYAQQKAHLYLRRPMDWFLWAIADAGIIEGLPRPTVHHDAATIHSAVVELGERVGGADGQQLSEILVYFAAHNQQPDIPPTLPTPYPVRIDRADGVGAGERWSRDRYHGQVCDILVRWTETVGEAVPVFKRYGKNRMKRVGTRIVQHPVEYCPIDWRPDLVWVIAVAGIYERWRAAMRLLRAELSVASFRDHDLSGEGFSDTPLPFRLEELMANREIQIEMAYGIRHVEVRDTGGSITTRDGESLYQRWASAKVGSGRTTDSVFPRRFGPK